MPAKKKRSKQYRWQLKQQAKGNCIVCGKRRKRDGTLRRCRPCADKKNELQRKYYWGG